MHHDFIAELLEEIYHYVVVDPRPGSRVINLTSLKKTGICYYNRDECIINRRLLHDMRE